MSGYPFDSEDDDIEPEVSLLPIFFFLFFLFIAVFAAGCFAAGCFFIGFS